MSELDQIKEIFPNASARTNKNTGTVRIHLFGTSYVSQNEFSKEWFIFIDGLRFHTPYFDYIIRALKEIKDA